MFIGSDLSKQDSEGLTALGWACVRGRAQAAQVLLDRGAEINQADKTGRIPLDLAAVQGNPTLVQVIIKILLLLIQLLTKQKLIFKFFALMILINPISFFLLQKNLFKKPKIMNVYYMSNNVVKVYKYIIFIA